MAVAAADAQMALAAYVPGTRAWFVDKEKAWISGTLASKVAVTEAGDVTMDFTVDDTDGETRQVKTTIDQLRGKDRDKILPPLRNPPLLEATDDLTELSHLNEPSGE